MCAEGAAGTASFAHISGSAERVALALLEHRQDVAGRVREPGDVRPHGAHDALLVLLGALVALELKIGEFEPEYIGKMQFYLSVLDDTVRLPEEQPSIGIILCKSKDRLIVEYALKDATLPIGVSSYSVTPNIPSRLQGQLPSAEQIASLLAGID